MVGAPPAVRIHGELTPVEGAEAYSPASLQDAVYGMLMPDQIQQFEESPESRNELDFAYGLSGVGRFRCNIHRQRGSIGVVVRAVPSEVPKLEALNLPPEVEVIPMLRKGLVLMTGPTGSGKSTTLAALIDQINDQRADHIITIEDPIEYLHRSKKSYVSQREVGPAGDTLSFRNALKYSLRQDPDVILVGEMRDYETIGIALTAVETGHLVFGTLHTPNAPQTVSRIIDVFPPSQQPQIRAQLSYSLEAVIAQILLPSSGGRGRVAAVEVMRSNTAIRTLIRENKIEAIHQAMETGTKDGMLTMDQCMQSLVANGRTDAATVLPYVRTATARKNVEGFLATAA